MDRHIEVIGIDHGWSGMKTVSQVFTTGVKGDHNGACVLTTWWSTTVPTIR